MNSANNRNASAGASAKARGSSSKSSVRANIGKGKPSVTVASPPPTSVSQELSQQQSSSAGVSVENPQKSSSGTPASTVPDPSMKDSSHKMHSLEGGSKGRDRFTPQQHLKSHQRNSSFRKGSHPPGSYSQNHISHRSFNGRDSNDQHAFIDLSSTITKQMEYYFSPESLQKNIFLCQHMDEQGWVPVSVIAGFHKVKQLVKGIPDCILFILRAVRGSTIVETKGDMIRKRKNDHLQSSNGEGTSEVTASNQMKDHLRGFSAWDKVEDIRNSFFNFTFELPQKMEMHDKIIVIDAMKGLRDDLQHKYDPIKQKFDVASESHSKKIVELVDKHPYVVTPAFQELLSDEQKIQLQLFDMEIAVNKSKLPKESEVSDGQLVKFKALHQELQLVEDEYKSLHSKVLEYGQMIRYVDSFISIVHNKVTV
ncbi:hypothetical protein MKW98_009484 [Papaver atlanticum]|uniref:HTH La-type RNA-binding domain-containing protein n=1 Tax=Papaver atlanticum TaxID=357466 RepID=A0AAD4SFZ1_9MAGN|nr:hypothetical protein MKW98_009484 [Papaver atlanticum]